MVDSNVMPAQPAVKAGHPRGLYTLFFTEMWERFSYYGMRTLLVLFMTDQIVNGGMAMTDGTATAIYGIYTAAVYLVALPGGWIADRLIGMQRSIWYGGIIIMLGHFTLAIPGTWSFYLGLAFVVMGTGMLKPTISATVGELYPQGGAQRDAGFTIYYMGINLGAFLGPLVCSFLGEQVNWHYGFAAAGVGMFFGLLQFHFTKHHLGTAGLLPPHANPDPVRQAAFARKSWAVIVIALAVFFGYMALVLNGQFTLNPVLLAEKVTYIIVAMATLFFAFVLLFGGLTTDEKKRTVVIIVLFLSTALFWAGFEQSGSSLNLFADRYTDRSFLGGFFPEGVHPAGWYQSLNPFFIIALAPLYAWMWVALARRMMEPSVPVKFGLGLIIMGTGFLTMYFAAHWVLKGNEALPYWLITTFLLHTMGELALSPVGLSATTKLAPKNFKSQMMGIWFVGTALGNLVAGLLAGHATGGEGLEDMPATYMQIFLTSAGGGLLLLLLYKPIKNLMVGVR